MDALRRDHRWSASRASGPADGVPRRDPGRCAPAACDRRLGRSMRRGAGVACRMAGTADTIGHTALGDPHRWHPRGPRPVGRRPRRRPPDGRVATIEVPIAPAAQRAFRVPRRPAAAHRRGGPGARVSRTVRRDKARSRRGTPWTRAPSHSPSRTALRVRSLPVVSDDSARLTPLLKTGTGVFVLDGPTIGSGYDWYEVVVPTIRDGTGCCPAGSVAGADDRGSRRPRSTAQRSTASPWMSSQDGRGRGGSEAAVLRSRGGAASPRSVSSDVSPTCAARAPLTVPAWLAPGAIPV